jgi:hypothetical protein
VCGIGVLEFWLVTLQLWSRTVLIVVYSSSNVNEGSLLVLARDARALLFLVRFCVVMTVVKAVVSIRISCMHCIFRKVRVCVSCVRPVALLVYCFADRICILSDLVRVLASVALCSVLRGGTHPSSFLPFFVFFLTHCFPSAVDLFADCRKVFSNPLSPYICLSFGTSICSSFVVFAEHRRKASN